MVSSGQAEKSLRPRVRTLSGSGVSALRHRMAILRVRPGGILVMGTTASALKTASSGLPSCSQGRFVPVSSWKFRSLSNCGHRYQRSRHVRQDDKHACIGLEQLQNQSRDCHPLLGHFHRRGKSGWNISSVRRNPFRTCRSRGKSHRPSRVAEQAWKKGTDLY